MAYTETIANILAEARSRADAETPDPTADFTTDVELIRYANKSYKQLIDLICSQGDAAIDLLAVSTTLTTPFVLPTDYYRLVGLDGPNPGSISPWIALRPFQFKNRNTYTDTQFPRYRIVNGALMLTPSDSTVTSVRLWYVPVPATLTDVSSVQSFNGWDDFLVGSIAAAICVKEDRDPSPHLGYAQAAASRILEACSRLAIAEPKTIAETEHQYEEIYDLI